MRIEREHTAALIVDFQERLVPAIADHEALMERVQILLQGLKALEIPMTVTQQYTKGLGMSVPEVWEASGETEYLDKISFSALEVAEPKIHDKKYILLCIADGDRSGGGRVCACTCDRLHWKQKRE